MSSKYFQNIINKKTISIILIISIFFVPFVSRSNSNITIDKLNKLIDNKKKEIEKLNKEYHTYDKNLEILRKDFISLQNQISILNNDIAQTELEIKRINLQAEQYNLEIVKLNNFIKEKKQKINKLKQQLSNFLRLININDNIDYLTVLVGYHSFSDFFDQVQYTKNVKKQVFNLLKKIQLIKNNLEEDKNQVLENNNLLTKLKIEKEKKKISLEEEKEAKKHLLEQTQNSEAKFQELIAQVRAEKRKLEFSLEEIEKELRQKLTQKAFEKFQVVDNIKFSWPIPFQGIVTYFHDKHYPYRKIVGEHSGLDLRTLVNGHPVVGMPVRAAASGSVVKIINNGRFVGNAIYILHGINVMTAYYHMSKINVKEDQFVNRGQIIGLSGGMPGQYGAGLSTGPHLHFEVRVNGIPVDPLDYLPSPQIVFIKNLEEVYNFNN